MPRGRRIAHTAAASQPSHSGDGAGGGDLTRPCVASVRPCIPPSIRSPVLPSIRGSGRDGNCGTRKGDGSAQTAGRALLPVSQVYQTVAGHPTLIRRGTSFMTPNDASCVWKAAVHDISPTVQTLRIEQEPRRHRIYWHTDVARRNSNGASPCPHPRIPASRIASTRTGLAEHGVAALVQHGGPVRHWRDMTTRRIASQGATVPEECRRASLCSASLIIYYCLIQGVVLCSTII